jgi:transcriptional regulator with XRE-family HTH domain
MNVAALHNAELAYRSAAKRAETLRAKRNGLVTIALAEGWTHARIAEATGLTRGRVGQLAQSNSAPNPRRRGADD